ncbi:hypothetical protein [Nocardia concava]|uniref:hypothetical protein n=1 Tax=Nocardia concava TaxID=257281 RepID=UPI0012F9FC84|nr:hypothetical protein [Nocardia concava]
MSGPHFPQQPYQGAGQPSPQYAYGAYPYGPPPVAPSPKSVTAIIAGVLSLLGGARAVLGSLALPLLETDPDLDPSGFWGRVKLFLLVAVGFGVLLLIGGILMLMRKRISQVLLGIGGIGTLVSSIGLTIAMYNHFVRDYGGDNVSVNWDFTIFGIIGAAFNVAQLVLTFWPSTSRWLANKPAV